MATPRADGRRGAGAQADGKNGLSSTCRRITAGGTADAVEPKNLLLNLGAATAMGLANPDVSQTVIVMIVYLLAASVFVVGPVVYLLALGATAEKELNCVKVWLVQNNAVTAVVYLLLGIKLISEFLRGS